MNEKTDNQHLVSVILTTYNGEKYLAETLESVLNQTYTNLEIIIVDDCSTDSTVDIIKSYNDERIKLSVNEKNLGIGDNTNKALSLATGEFIMMQDHDDISSPSRAELQLKCLIDHPDVTGVVLPVKSFNSANPPSEIYNKCDEYHIDKTPKDLKTMEIYGGYIPHPTLFYRKSILDKLDSYYNNNFTIAGDLYFIEKLNSAGARWILLSDYLLAYRVHNSMTTKNNKLQSYKEVLAVSTITIKRYFNDISDNDALVHAKLMTRRELLKVENDNLINHFKKILLLGLDTDNFDASTLKIDTVSRLKTSAILANIYSPFTAYKVYRSIDELKPYTVSFGKFLGEYQKRFFRNLSWMILGNERKLD